MMEKKGFVSAQILACYVNDYYMTNINPNGKISDIVLQKTLYFLFAYWGGFIRQGLIDHNEEIINQPEYLYDDRIEAWTYGPVLPEIYKLKKKNELFIEYDKDIFKGNELMESTINGLLNDILRVDPFRLVSISHMDKCWRDNYIIDDDKHDREILKQTILEEYGNKVKI